VNGEREGEWACIHCLIRKYPHLNKTVKAEAVCPPVLLKRMKEDCWAMWLGLLILRIYTGVLRSFVRFMNTGSRPLMFMSQLYKKSTPIYRLWSKASSADYFATWYDRLFSSSLLKNRVDWTSHCRAGLVRMFQKLASVSAHSEIFRLDLSFANWSVEKSSRVRSPSGRNNLDAFAGRSHRKPPFQYIHSSPESLLIDVEITQEP
jgi:hypothetical protein